MFWFDFQTKNQKNQLNKRKGLSLKSFCLLNRKLCELFRGSVHAVYRFKRQSHKIVGQTHSKNSSANCRVCFECILSVFDHFVGLTFKGIS